MVAEYGDRHENLGDRGFRYGDRHDVRYNDQERSTSNVQLSTFNGVTERAHGGRDIGTDTKIWATGAPRYGDRHDVRYNDQER